MFAAMYSTQAILPELSRDFDVSPSRAGLSVSVVVLAVAAGAWAWGPISDRVGRPRAIRAAARLLLPPTLAVARAPTFELLLVFRVLQGLCMPGLLVVGAPYVVEAFVPRVGARAMGWWASALVLGGLVGRVGVALAAGVVGWRVAIGALTVLPLGAAISMRDGLPDVPPPVRSGRVLRSLLRPALLAVTATGGALFFTFVGTFTYITFRLEEPPFSLDDTTASLVFGLWVIGVFGPAIGRLAQRTGWRRLAAVSLLLAAVGVSFTVIESIVPVVLGLACLATAMFAGYTATQLGVGDVARTDRGSASALYFSAYYGSGALGAYVPGLAWESWGWSGVTALGFSALGLAAAGLFAVRRTS